MSRTLQVDVWFDLICPWCWIGKRLFAQAQERLAQSDPDVRLDLRWHSVQLIPQVPADGWPFAQFYQQRLGSPQAVQARQAQVLAAARLAGAFIDFARIQTFPNTALAHRLLTQARTQLEPAAFEALLERLFEAYFMRGENLGDAQVLTEIAASFHVDTTEAAAERALSQQPGGGVPTFLFGERVVLSGAQSPEVLWTAMRQALAAQTSDLKTGNAAATQTA